MYTGCFDSWYTFSPKIVKLLRFYGLELSITHSFPTKTYRRAKVMAYFMSQCQLWHLRGHSAVVVDERDDPSVQTAFSGLIHSPDRLGVSLVLLTYSSRSTCSQKQHYIIKHSSCVKLKITKKQVFLQEPLLATGYKVENSHSESNLDTSWIEQCTKLKGVKTDRNH